MSICKRIMNLEVIKHMTLQRMTFDTYVVISPQNVQLGDNSMAEAIRMKSIVVGLETKDKMNKI